MAAQISRTGSASRREIEKKLTRGPRRVERYSDGSGSEDDAPKPMTKDEEALMSMVLGDDDDFMANLHGDGAEERDEEGDEMDVEGEDGEENLEEVDDAEVRLHAQRPLFTLLTMV